MADFRIVIRNGAVTSFIPQWENLNYKERIIEGGLATFTIQGDEPCLGLMVELATDIEIYRGGTRRFRGRLFTLDDVIDGDNYFVSVTVVDYSLLLQARSLPTDLTFQNVAQGTVVTSLIAVTQALTSGDLGITTGTITDGSILRSRSYLAGEYIGKLIDDLAAVIAGFDWWIDDQLRTQIRYPRRAQASGLVLMHGAGVSRIQRQSTAGSFRNWVRETGAEGIQPAIASALPDSRGRWELQEANSNVSEPSTLQEKADGRLDELSTPRASFAVKLDLGAYDSLPVVLGDLPTVVMKRNRLDVAVVTRIVEIGFTADSSGREDVTLVAVEEP